MNADGLPDAAIGGDPESVVISVPCDLAALGDARFHLATAAAAWGVRDVEAVEVIATELIGNAIVHARSPALVRLSRLEGGQALLEVTDESAERPVKITPYERHTRGLGLHVVEALAERWGVTVGRPGGSKVVWAVIDSSDD
ncbi:MAG TPA: ATP-binding protein [Acidimicrobiales bacterium]|nr:ATP-binding protein [Acidimicrobiales bacterium]